MDLVTQIEFPKAHSINEMLLHDGNLIVIWTMTDFIEFPDAPRVPSWLRDCCCYTTDNGWWHEWMSRINIDDVRGCCCERMFGQTIYETMVSVFDTNGDFSAPLRTYSQNGEFNSARMVGTSIYLISNYTPYIPENLARSDIDSYVPNFSVNGITRRIRPSGIVLPNGLDKIEYTVIGGLNVAQDNMSVSIKASLGWTETVYVSKDNIYLTRSVRRNDDGTIAVNDNGVRGWWWSNWDDGTTVFTDISRFAVNGGNVSHAANGAVQGTVRNQFHFDEHNGNLRVVTESWANKAERSAFNGTGSWQMLPLPEDKGWWTEQNSWRGTDNGWWDIPVNWNRMSKNNYDWNAWSVLWNQTRNLTTADVDWTHEISDAEYYELYGWELGNGRGWGTHRFSLCGRFVYYYQDTLDYDADWGLQGGILHTLDSNLNTIAEVHRVGFGENVQSVRFMGDLAYIVTFWQTDPLFAFDLSDPANPVHLGELKIPGFSRYLHSWDDGLLLGMGVDTNDDGIRVGLKMTMFDVSDNSDLSELHVHTFSRIQSSQWGDWGTWQHTPVEDDHRAALVSGEHNIIGFPYQDEGKAYYAVFSFCRDGGFELLGTLEANNGGRWGMGGFNRGLFIGDYIYAVSNYTIVSARIGDELTEIKSLELLAIPPCCCDLWRLKNPHMNDGFIDDDIYEEYEEETSPSEPTVTREARTEANDANDEQPVQVPYTESVMTTTVGVNDEPVATAQG
jgi:uncharacterized secreted protein with C-terminal beta-propeller domain